MHRCGVVPWFTVGQGRRLAQGPLPSSRVLKQPQRTKVLELVNSGEGRKQGRAHNMHSLRQCCALHWGCYLAHYSWSSFKIHLK
jgi:hypothetical protein